MLLFSTMLAFPTIAIGGNIFGPVQFLRAKGKPKVYTESFRATEGIGTLVVKKGNIKDCHRITGALIKFNGQRVMRPCDFKKKMPHIELPVNLLDENQLEVKLIGKPGSSLTIDFFQDSPSVSLSAIPQSIIKGDSAELSWDCMLTDSCSILPDIGSVDPSGSIAVAPTQTTTYTVNASGAGGVSTKTVTVEVIQPPTARIDIDPEEIASGESARLRWSTQGSENVTIVPGIGSVQPEGAMTVTPEETTTYTIRAEGRGGQATDEATLKIHTPALVVGIENPLHLSSVYRPEIEVSGTVSAADASVTVNGVKAIVKENRFFAEAVSLQFGENMISATVDDGQYTTEDNAIVYFAALDLNPVQIVYLDYHQDLESLKTSGSVKITISNNGLYDISKPYRIILFEDLNMSGQYERGQDNPIGLKEVDRIHHAQATVDVIIDFNTQMAFRDNLIHAYVDFENNLSEIDEFNNLIDISHSAIDLSASRLVVQSDQCPALLPIRVRLGNAGALPVESGVPVTFYWESEDQEKSAIGTVFSSKPLAPGQYEDITLDWPDPVEEAAGLIVAANDDGSNSGNLIGDDYPENNAVRADLTDCHRATGQDSSLFGCVINAIDGAGIPSAQVDLYQPASDAGAAPVAQTLTDETGYYRFTDLLPDIYELVAGKELFESDQRSIKLTDVGTGKKQDLYISPQLAADEIRVILSWGATPADLEAHMTGPNPDGCRHHCYYWNREIPGARLDADATRGFGPETITLSGNPAGVYRYYVHDFSGRLENVGDGLAASSATVRVIYGDGRAPVTFAVPYENGSVWHVFDIDGTSGSITLVNRMGFQDEPGKIDFPKILSQPPTYVEAGLTYTYPLLAMDPDTDTLLFRLLDAPEGMHIDPFSGHIDWTPQPDQTGAHAVSVSVTDPHCGEDTQQFSVRVNLVSAPAVSFWASPCSGVNPGGDITLYWNVHSADSIEIDHDIGQVAENGQLTIPSPESPTAYTLTAINEGGTTIRSVPNLSSDDATFQICETADDNWYQLEWEAGCATDCSISPLVGQVPCSGAMMLTLAEPIEFTLSASNPGGGGAIKTAKPKNCDGMIPDGGSQKICSWDPGDPIKITWSAPWAAEVKIEPDVGPVPNTGMTITAPMQPTTYTLTATDTYGQEFSRLIDVPDLMPVTISSFAVPVAIASGQSAELHWSATCADNCRVDPGIGLVERAGSMVVTPEQLPRTYTIFALKDGAEIDSTEITIKARAPSLWFYASPGIIKPGEPVTLKWQAEYASTCRIEPDIGDVDCTGSITIQPEKNTTYDLIAEGIGGTSSSSATITYVKPTVQILADPDRILPGESAVLTWVFSNADQCVIEPGIGEVDLGGNAVVHPAKTTTYVISATGPGGEATDSVTVALPAPTVTISANPPHPKNGEAVNLVWQTTHADHCVILPNIGSVGSQGSMEIFPTKPVNYTITAYGPGGYATGQTTIECSAPTLQLSISPQNVHAGEAASILWSSMGTEKCMLSSGIGEVAPEGTLKVYPVRDTTYVLSSTGCGGESTASANVSILCRPQAGLIEPDGVGDTVNSSYTIHWTDADCDDNAAISIFYDDDAHGADGNPIVTGLHEDPDGSADYFTWNTSQVPAGDYHIYLVIQDGWHEPMVAYSSGVITVDRSLPVLNETQLAEDFGKPYDIAPDDIDMEGNIAIVGYRGYGAYIYTLNKGEWSLQQIIECPDETFNAEFGAAVGISGGWAVVGASVDFSYQGEDPGAAYMFHRENNQWVFNTELIPSEAGLGLYGAGVAMDGEFVVVASGGVESYMGTRAPGRAFIFKREDNTWVEQQKLMPSDSAEYDYFGSSVEIDKNVMIIGADRGLYGGNDHGAAYIFRTNGQQWNEEDILTDTATNTRMGSAVSVSGNYVIVGAYGTDDQEWDAGAVYVYHKDPLTEDSWQLDAKLVSADPRAFDHFGKSVAINGHFAVVSAWWKDVAGSNSGAAYLYKLEGDIWTEKLELIAGDASSSDRFGSNVALGNGLIMVSSETAAYLYETCSASLVADPQILAPGDPTTLRWHSVLADSCSIQPDIGDVDPAGELNVLPAESTEYTIHATGEYGENSQTTQVLVGTWQPTVDIFADAGWITIGEPATISWNSAYANTVSIEPDIGGVGQNGTITVFPIETTTYLITAEGPGGSVTGQVTIMVAIAEPTAELELQPEAIDLGEPATLTWSTQYATEVSISPDVGTVAASGSMTIIPDDTMTYVLTAVGPGGTAGSQATVTVVFPPPTADLSVDPFMVGSGDPAILTWTTNYTRQCIIEPDVGTVDLSGSIQVTPTETTLYTLTAIGPAGSATDTLTVTVIPKPQITFSADPTTIQSGDPVTLVWDVQYADSCLIEPGIGSVDLRDSLTVIPVATTTYSITATGAGGTSTESTTVGVGSPISIQILSPADGASLNRPDVMVRGTFSNTSGIETGLVINGSVAMVYGNQFVVNHVPLQEGENTIAVTATDVDGHMQEKIISLYNTLPEHHIELAANIESGSSPLEAGLRIDGTFSIVASAISYAGPGAVEFVESGEDRYRIRLTDEGVYYLTAEVVHETVTYTDTIAVVVVDASGINTLLQQKWADMKTALIAEDVGKALTYHQNDSQEKYAAIYNALSGNLPMLAQQMRAISLIYFEDTRAKYRILQDHDVEGQTVTITYYIYFSKDEDGIWKIVRY